MTPERKHELDVIVENWERRTHRAEAQIFPRALLEIADPSLPNHLAILKRQAGEMGISLDELLEWKKLEVEEHLS